MTEDRDDVERLRRAFAEPGPAPDPDDCPSPETIWEAVRGELPPDEIRAVVEHTATCPACAEDWRIAAAFEEELRALRSETEEAAAPQPAIAWRRMWIAAAAALVLTVLGLQTRSWLGENQPPAYRNEGSTAIRTLVPEGAALPRQAFDLKWSPVPGALSYDLLVSTETLQTVADARGLTAPQYRIPESALADLSSGTKLYWHVEAALPEGGRVASRTFSVALDSVGPR